MKLLLLIMLFLFIATANGQSLNPYVNFGYTPRNEYVSTFKGYSLENKDTTANISRMVIDIEKSEVLLYGTDSTLLNQISITGKDILRFLSVDPIAHQYPELTPYQFASNRPIDGIDQDGLEWSKVRTYNPKTGVTNIHFQVKLKIKNESQVFKDIEGLRREIIAQFPKSFADVKNGNTTYSGSIQVEFVKEVHESDFLTTIEDKPGEPSGGVTYFTNTIHNKNIAYGYDTRTDVPANTPRTAKDLAHDLIHELFHTAGPSHPDDENQAADIQLITVIIKNNDGKRIIDHKLGPNAIWEQVIHNILNYPNVKINGKPINEYVPNKFDRSKLSPGQINQIINQIDQDANPTH